MSKTLNRIVAGTVVVAGLGALLATQIPRLSQNKDETKAVSVQNEISLNPIDRIRGYRLVSGQVVRRTGPYNTRLDGESFTFVAYGIQTDNGELVFAGARGDKELIGDNDLVTVKLGEPVHQGLSYVRTILEYRVH